MCWQGGVAVLAPALSAFRRIPILNSWTARPPAAVCQAETLLLKEGEPIVRALAADEEARARLPPSPPPARANRLG